MTRVDWKDIAKAARETSEQLAGKGWVEATFKARTLLADLADEVERLTRLNDDKFRHLQAYCKVANEDRATIARLTRERDALTDIIVQPWTSEDDGAKLWKINIGWWDTAGTREKAVARVREAAGLDPEPGPTG